MERTIIVPYDISKKIKVEKDLADFYAYIEEDMTNREVLELSYQFDEKDQDRIDDLLNDCNYQAGVYNCKNIDRMFGSLNKYDLNAI